MHLNTLTLPLIFAVLAPLPGPQERVQKLYVANSAGNDIHVIDTATNRVIKRVEVGPEPHGLVATANGDQIFITIENTKGDEGELLWFDPYHGHGDAADDDRPAPEPARLHARRQARLHPLRRCLLVGHRHGEGRGHHQDRHGWSAAQHALFAGREADVPRPEGLVPRADRRHHDPPADRRDPTLRCAPADRHIEGRDSGSTRTWIP